MFPGTYLRKRREAARLGVIQAAANMAALSSQPSWSPALARSHSIARLADAEADIRPLTRPEAEQLRAVFAFDVAIYFALRDLQIAGPRTGLPEPQLCRACACSFLDPCLPNPGETGERGQCCHWVETDLCSACQVRIGA